MRGSILQWGRVIAPNLRLSPKYLFDKLKASAYRCKKRSVAFRIRQNAFWAGVPSCTPLRSSRRSPDPPIVGRERVIPHWGRDILSPLPIAPPTLLGTDTTFGAHQSVHRFRGRHCLYFFALELHLCTICS